jgi:ABC-type uncharacterized transport system involved in gliding motility auxiliary subunit
MTLPKLFRSGFRLLPVTRWAVRPGGRWLSARIYTAAVVGALVLVNVLAARFPWRYDATLAKAFTLAPETKAVLAGLPGPVAALGFYSGDSPGEQHLTDLLKEYAAASKGRFSWQAVDPAANPSLVQRYDVSTPGTTVLIYREKHEKLDQWDVMGGIDPAGRPQVTGEQALTNGLLRLTSPHSPKAYFLEGHGEKELTALQRQLHDGGYVPAPLNFATQPAVPADADLLVIPGPVRDFAQQEIDLIGQWSDQKGGKLLVMLPPGQQLPRLEGWLKTWGVTARHDIVVDPARHYMYDPTAPVPDYRYHPITTRVAKARLAMVMPGARSLIHGPEQQGLAYNDLLVSSGKAWGETNQQEPAHMDARDTTGPLTMALAVTRPQSASPAKPAGRLVVIGSSAFATDDALQLQGNLGFTMGALGWLADRGEAVTLRAREALAAPLLLTNNAAVGIFLATVVAIPLLFLVAGGAVWYRRRHL